MTASRSSALALAAVLAAALAAAPAAAQLDIVPQTFDEPPPAEPAPPPEAAEPPLLDPETPIGEVEVGEVERVDPEAVGLIEAADAGFGYDMWRGSHRGLVERLIPLLPAGTTSRTLNDLARRLLLSSAAPPEGPKGANLLALRIERLAAMGLSVDVSHLMRAVPRELDDVALARPRIDAMLLNADYVGACALARDLVRRDDAPYWEKVLIFCQALNGHHDAAALGLELLRERGVEDPALAKLLAVLAGTATTPLDSLIDPTPLHLAMLRTARIPAPEDAVDTADPAIARAIAFTASIPLELRLEAAERAEALGVLPTETLAELYENVPFSPDDLADPGRRLDAGTTGPMARALLYQAVGVQVVPAARAEMLSTLWRVAAEAGGWDGFATAARVTREMTVGLRPLPELVSTAGEVARALYAAGEPEAAEPWLALAESQASVNAAAARAAASLAPVVRLAGGGAGDEKEDAGVAEVAEDGEDGEDGEAADLADWWTAHGDLPEPTRRHRASLLFALLTALGEPVPAAALTPLVGGAVTAWAKAPLPVLIHRLGVAAEAGRVGETVLIALVVLAPTEPGVPGPLALNAGVAALKRVGLEAEARSLAVEAALASAF